MLPENEQVKLYVCFYEIVEHRDGKISQKGVNRVYSKEEYAKHHCKTKNKQKGTHGYDVVCTYKEFILDGGFTEQELTYVPVADSE